MMAPKTYQLTVERSGVASPSCDGLVFKMWCKELGMEFTLLMDFMPDIKNRDEIVLEVSETGVAFYKRAKEVK